MHFSEIIKFQFGKNCFLYFTAFLNYEGLDGGASKTLNTKIFPFMTSNS